MTFCIFEEASEVNYMHLMGCVERYYKVIGQLVNFNESIVSFSKNMDVGI